MEATLSQRHSQLVEVLQNPEAGVWSVLAKTLPTISVFQEGMTNSFCPRAESLGEVAIIGDTSAATAQLSTS